MQQEQCSRDDVLAYLSAGTTGPRDSLAEIVEPITDAEVLRAIKLCKRGNAQGPDELPNDWYRDHGPELAPIFAKLLNLWLAEGVVPASFAMANTA